MGVQLISASGTQNGLIVNPDGTITVAVSGGSSSSAGSQVWVKNFPGSTIIQQVGPTNSSQNNPFKQLIYVPYSGTSYGTGSVIGSIIQFIGAGSNVKVLGYDSAYNLNSIGSWC